MLDRRRFLSTLVASAVVHPLPAVAESSAKRLRIGLITDVHKDIIHDADARMTSFVDAMKKANADAVMQLGDFCTPKPANRDFLNLYRSLPCPQYHVIGNHDMDGGFSREQVVSFLGMPGRYYSFDLGGFHFIVLDANDRPDGWKSGYPSHISADQLAWLGEDLEKTALPTFILSHQSLERPSCIDNQEAVRSMLERSRMKNGKRKVAACLNGHWHIDHNRTIHGIPYIHINSASYYWLGNRYKHEVLEPELAVRFPVVSHTAPYKSAVHTILEIDPAAGVFSLSACKSEWLGPSPADLEYKSDKVEAESIYPGIRGWKAELA